MRKNFKHTQESKNKMSEAKKKGIKEGKIKVWNKGKKLHYKVWNKGKHIWANREHPRGMLGKKAWNKGLTKETDKRVMKYAISESKSKKGKHFSPKTEFKKGIIPWNKNKKGLQKSKRKGKIFEELYGIEKARKMNKKKAKEKIEKKNKGKVSCMKGKKHSLKARIKMKEARKNQIFPKKDTLIEVKIQNFLKQFHIEFYTHQYMHLNHGYQCDIFIPRQETEGIIIPQKTVIECDGCYWHGCPTCNLRPHKNLKKQKKKDKIRTKELKEKGFRM